MKLLSSMLSVLVVLSHVAFSLGNSTPEEEKAIEKIELLGGTVQRDDTSPSRPVIGISFRSDARFSDQYLHLLRSFPQLKLLKLSGRKQITDAGMADIGKLTGLEKLDLATTGISDAKIMELANLQNLVELDLPYTSISAARETELIRRLPNLNRELVVAKSIKRLLANVERDRLNPNQPVVSVEVRNFGQFNIQSSFTDGDLERLEVLMNLRSLSLTSDQLTDAGLVHVGRLSGLTTLHLEVPKLTEVGFAHLQQLTHLTHLTTLTLSGENITDNVLKAIGPQDKLQFLSLIRTSIRNLPLSENSQMRNLTRLIIGSSELTDQGLKEIGELKQLRELTLLLTPQMTKDGLSALRHLDQLEDLTLLLPNNRNLDFSPVIEITSLKKLQIQSYSTIDPRERFRQQIANEGVPGFELMVYSDETMATIARLPHLHTLILQGAGASEHAIANLRDAHSLTTLNLQLSNLTDLNLESLGEVEQLQNLTLSKNQRSDLRILKLARLQNLETLVLSCDGTLRADLKHLSKLKKLKQIELKQVKELSDESFTELMEVKNASPELVIRW